MRTILHWVMVLVLMAAGGCAWWGKPKVPEPTKAQIVLHGIVDFDKAAIKQGSEPILNEAAETLNQRGSLAVLIEGHCDSRGSVERNRRLSLKRAQSVADYLVKHGVARERMVVIGKGAIEPIASNDTREGRALNRRVVITVYQP